MSVPLERCCRGATQRLLGADADFGKGGSDKRWYYGCKLLLSVTPQGVVTGFVAGPANTEERWLAEALLSGRESHGVGAWCGAGACPAPQRSAGKLYHGPSGPESGRGSALACGAATRIWATAAIRGRGGRSIGGRTTARGW